MPTNARVNEWAQKLDFAGLEQQHGLPAGILTNLVYQESRGNPSARSPVGAKGLCQFMDGTAKQYGVDVTSPASSAQGAARYLEDLMDRFNGDSDKAIAAYNCGQARVGRLVKQYGENWPDHLPAETKHYLQVVGDGIGSTYAQRVSRGESVSSDDRDREESRRLSRLREAGYTDQQIEQLKANEVLGMVFFALVRSFVEANINGAEQGRGLEKSPSEPEKEFSPAVNKRASEIKASGEAPAKLPVSDVDPSEPVAPPVVRVAKASTERTPITVG